MPIYISWDHLPGAAPVYDKTSGSSQPVYDWDKCRWVHQRNVRRTYAPSVYKDTWKQLAAAVADGYLELIKKYSDGELLISFCKAWSWDTKNNPVDLGFRCALTFFPKGFHLTLKEIRNLPEESIGHVPDWFEPVRVLNKGTATILSAMES
jgi:hypothetical protein